jgi:hypothetical protein
VKPLIFVVFFLSLYIYPISTDAARQTSLSKEERSERIELLRTQVQKLQKQLALLLRQPSTKTAPEFSYKTKFYTGTYESLYHVSNGRLISQYNTEVPSGDQLLWNTFSQIAGSSFIDTYISEFRIYNDTESEVSAFVEEKPDNTWILGFNREGEKLGDIYNDSSIHDLLLHEYAHIVFFNTDDIEDDFKQAFWNVKSQTYSSNTFVSEYAATNAVEDMVESFVFFVQEDIPTEKGIVYDKMRFFTEYPKMIKLRNTLRAGNYF